MLMVTTDRWRPDGGGRERYLAELVAHISARGRRVSVLCGSPAAAAVFADCRVQRGPRPLRELRLRAAVRDARAADPALRVLALSPVCGATHYQLHDGLFEDAFAAERDAMRSRLRRALVPASIAFNHHRQRLMADQMRMISQAQAVMAFSRAAANAVVERVGIPAARVAIARPGVDLSRFRPDPNGDARPNASAGTLRLAFVGHNFALKGLTTAIEALDRLRRNGVNATLTVAGADRPAWYRSLAGRLGVATAVRFAGALAPDAVADLYRASDLLVHPTFYDPFPRVVIEALACGCPVVTTARCGAAEMLTDGENGFVIDDPCDAPSIARRAAELTDPSRRSAVRRAAADAGRRFEAAGHFDRVIEWLESIPRDLAERSW